MGKHLILQLALKKCSYLLYYIITNGKSQRYLQPGRTQLSSLSLPNNHGLPVKSSHASLLVNKQSCIRWAKAIPSPAPCKRTHTARRQQTIHHSKTSLEHSWTGYTLHPPKLSHRFAVSVKPRVCRITYIIERNLLSSGSLTTRAT